MGDISQHMASTPAVVKRRAMGASAVGQAASAYLPVAHDCAAKPSCAEGAGPGVQLPDLRGVQQPVQQRGAYGLAHGRTAGDAAPL